MKHPHSSKVMEVIKALEAALPMAVREDHLDMMQTHVNDEYTCGTIHCHAGWFLIGANKLFLNGRRVNYTDGVIIINTLLGYGPISVLDKGICAWANDNPEIWGNRKGIVMFSCEGAFKSGTRPDGAQNLQHIIDHWKEVYGRLVAIEAATQPQKEYVIVHVDKTIPEQARKLTEALN